MCFVAELLINPKWSDKIEVSGCNWNRSYTEIICLLVSLYLRVKSANVTVLGKGVLNGFYYHLFLKQF